MLLQNDRLFAFSGLMFAGKDFVAKQARLTVHGFADPIYELCEHFNGTRDKSVPGIRRWMQLVGQWGWGCTDEDYEHSVERSVFTELVHRFGADYTKAFKWVDWSEYGRRKDFWVNILLTKLGLTTGLIKRDGQKHLFDGGVDAPGMNIAITNARFDHELSPLNSAGFCHYHVMCSEDTRRERMASLGYTHRQQDAVDKSEQMALRLNMEMGDKKVVWNDHRPMPGGREFLTLDDFTERSFPQFSIRHSITHPIGGAMQTA